MTTQCHLEPPAKCSAMHGGDHGFIRCLDQGDDVRQVRWLWRAPEFTNIGAGYKSTTSAENHDRLNVVVCGNLVDASRESSPDWLRQRVNWWIIDADDGDAVTAFDAYLAHSGSLIWNTLGQFTYLHRVVQQRER